MCVRIELCDYSRRGPLGDRVIPGLGSRLNISVPYIMCSWFIPTTNLSVPDIMCSWLRPTTNLSVP